MITIGSEKTLTQPKALIQSTINAAAELAQLSSARDAEAIVTIAVAEVGLRTILAEGVRSTSELNPIRSSRHHGPLLLCAPKPYPR
ncbi:MAG: hypothetical protein DCC75_11405 [Proteobacteria bacterium]|nr:MAG: hypothetical protein DCC75_11405 [Pseudomonadota bacterium]